MSMSEQKRVYFVIDMKSFFASVECAERHLDPFKTNLVVADKSRGEGAICLAVSPKMKSLGVKNRCRLYEIPKEIEYIVAKPQMKKYIEYASEIYGIYLKYIDKNGITAQAPDIRPGNRKEITGHYSKFVEDLKNYYSDYVLVRTPNNSYYEMVNPFAAFFWTIVDGVIKAIPKIKINRYGEHELRSLNQWVDELTKHTVPEDVNKMLNVNSQ